MCLECEAQTGRFSYLQQPEAIMFCANIICCVFRYQLDAIFQGSEEEDIPDDVSGTGSPEGDFSGKF